MSKFDLIQNYIWWNLNEQFFEEVNHCFLVLYSNHYKRLKFYTKTSHASGPLYCSDRNSSVHPIVWLPCAYAYVALFARRLTYNHYAIAHAYDAANPPPTRQWPGALKPKSYSLVEGNRSIETWKHSHDGCVINNLLWLMTAVITAVTRMGVNYTTDLTP